MQSHNCVPDFPAGWIRWIAHWLCVLSTAVQLHNNAFVKKRFTADFVARSGEDFGNNQEPKPYSKNQEGFTQNVILGVMCSNVE